MIRLDVEQGSPEWRAARACIPTASAFGRIITAKTGKAPMAVIDTEIVNARVTKRSWLSKRTFDPVACAVSGSKEI